MDSKRCSNGKEMVKELFLTTFHDMNSTALLRLAGQFKEEKKKKGKKYSFTKHIEELIATRVVEAKRIQRFREIHGGFIKG